MILLAFGDKVAPVVDRIYQTNLEAEAQHLWNSIESVLYNEDQIQKKNTEFVNCQWNETSESVQEFAERVAILGTSVQMTQEMMKAVFIKGMPKRLQTYLYTVK